MNKSRLTIGMSGNGIEIRLPGIYSTKKLYMDFKALIKSYAVFKQIMLDPNGEDIQYGRVDFDGVLGADCILNPKKSDHVFLAKPIGVSTFHRFCDPWKNSTQECRSLVVVVSKTHDTFFNLKHIYIGSEPPPYVKIGKYDGKTRILDPKYFDLIQGAAFNSTLIPYDRNSILYFD